jgi:GxxExxY protein
LACELTEVGISFKQQAPLPVGYKSVLLDCGYRLDFLIEDLLIVEVKSIEQLHPIHQAQLLTCLKLSKLRVGLLINFNVVTLRDGIKRMVM